MMSVSGEDSVWLLSLAAQLIEGADIPAAGKRSQFNKYVTIQGSERMSFLLS